MIDNNHNNNDVDVNDVDATDLGDNSKAIIPPELSKQLVKANLPDELQKRIPNETAKAVSELLRLFVLEARSRASLEAECDVEGDIDGTAGETADFVPIRPEHITKIAAELLMDFS